MNYEKLTNLIMVTPFVIVAAASIVSIVSDITQTVTVRREYERLAETQKAVFAFVEEAKKPFVATGYIVKRLDDGRFLISFSRPHPDLGKDRLLLNEVILSRKDFNAFQRFLIPETPQ